uniref:DNA N-6-adenine-methyltransferase n=1 Tax=Myoviridae sp. ct1ba2 TaxID=2827654 RepID=A0A8S5S6M2_9CAUD|nr:MAG TPA: DNA N-6-adenine-methyltransferase [Myoviridae sp. ct1ba2]
MLFQIKGKRKMKELENIKLIEDEKYKQFKKKFEHKVTTDDCYTPPAVYEAIKNYVIDYYNLENIRIERPFYPGGDYQHYEYSENSVVIDNPPFSILTEIKKFYMREGIKFFLFAPNLTLLSSSIDGVCHIVTNSTIVYANKAKVNTSFDTNMDEYVIRTDPELHNIIKKSQEDLSVTHPKYDYPSNVIISSLLGKCAKAGMTLKFKSDELYFIRCLENQKAFKKAIYGSGFLIGDERAKEMETMIKEIEAAKTIKWKLSDKEKKIIEELS